VLSGDTNGNAAFRPWIALESIRLKFDHRRSQKRHCERHRTVGGYEVWVLGAAQQAKIEIILCVIVESYELN